MVLQDTWLFSGSIRENIAYGREHVSTEAIVLAADVIRMMEQGGSRRARPTSCSRRRGATPSSIMVSSPGAPAVAVSWTAAGCDAEWCGREQS